MKRFYFQVMLLQNHEVMPTSPRTETNTESETIETDNKITKIFNLKSSKTCHKESQPTVTASREFTQPNKIHLP